MKITVVGAGPGGLYFPILRVRATGFQPVCFS